jgi:hypothetical protein
MKTGLTAKDKQFVTPKRLYFFLKDGTFFMQRALFKTGH